jgi:hypothetical protein
MQTIDGSAGTGSAVAYGDVGWVNMPLQTGCFFNASRRQIYEYIRYTSHTEDRSRLKNIVPERFPVGRNRKRHRKSQSECSCDGGTLGFPGGWSELGKPVCENSGLLMAD